MPARGSCASRPGWQGDILTQQGLVGAVIRRLPAHVTRRIATDDMRQAGLEGLLTARRLYDPARGTWSTYASSKIRWAILIAAGLTRTGWEPLPVGDCRHE